MMGATEVHGSNTINYDQPFGGLGSAGVTVGLNDCKDPFQPKCLCNSKTKEIPS